MLVCLNGKFIPHEDANLSINDGAFLFGDSLFETLKGQQQKILLQKQHLDRLEQSAQRLGFPCDRKKIEIALAQIAAALKSPCSRIRLTLSRGPFDGLAWPQTEHSWFLITASDYAELTDHDRRIGAKCIIAPNQRINPTSHLPQMKRGNYADCLYAKGYAQKSGAQEALFIDQHQNVLEGSTSNIFALRGDHLITPPADTLVLNGIMRQQVIKAAIELGMKVDEHEIPLNDLLQSDEAFLTNSLLDLLPVSNIDEHPINQGEIWISIIKTLKMRIET